MVDLVTFGVMLWIFHAKAAEFRSGWFVESLATQTLVIFAIRTRRVPFFRGHLSLPLILAAVSVVSVVSVVTVGSVLPATPLAHTGGFSPLPPTFLAALAGMVLGYLVLIEVGKRIFYRTQSRPTPPAPRSGATNQPERCYQQPGLALPTEAIRHKRRRYRPAEAGVVGHRRRRASSAGRVGDFRIGRRDTHWPQWAAVKARGVISCSDRRRRRRRGR